jgi:hypothetical protein
MTTGMLHGFAWDANIGDLTDTIGLQLLGWLLGMAVLTGSRLHFQGAADFLERETFTQSS